MDKVQTYINRIRNQGKRAYAFWYYKSILRNSPEPSREQFHISAMAAQAVRMNINELTKTAHLRPNTALGTEHECYNRVLDPRAKL